MLLFWLYCLWFAPRHVCLVTVQPQALVSSIARTDLVIIPATAIRSYEAASKGNRALIDWIGRQYKQGAEVASICSGAFMLAATGVLDGRACSTHWAYADA